MHKSIWKLNTGNNTEYRSSVNLKRVIKVNLKWKKNPTTEYEKGKENKLLSKRQ